jgi:hypothetical protein
MGSHNEYWGYVSTYTFILFGEPRYIAKFRHPNDGWMDEKLGEFPTIEEAKGALLARVAQYILSR